MSILSVDNISPVGSGTSVTVNNAATLVVNNVSISDEIIHTGDTNTAIKFPANDTVTIETAGSERVRVDSSGNFGINTNNPTAELDVERATGTVEVMLQSRDSSDCFVSFGDNGDSDIGQIRYAHSDNSMRFTTNTGERLRITSAGSVGINQDNPHALLSLGAGVNPIKLLLYDNEDNNKYGFGIQANELRQFYPDDSRLVFGTISRSDGSTFNEALRITANNNLLIGSSNESNNIRAGNKLAIVGTTPYIGMSITNYPGTAGNYAPMLDFNRSRGTSDQSMTSVAVNDKLGEIIFRGSDGNNFEDGAAIRAWVDGTPANDATDMPGRLTLCTSGDGDTTLHERLRINSSGYVTKPNNLCLSYTANASTDYYSGTIIYNTEVFDVGNSDAYNTSTGVFTAPVDGMYSIYHEYYAHTNNKAMTEIQKSTNGGSSFSPIKYGPRVQGTSSDYSAVSCTFLAPLNANDQIRIIRREGIIHINNTYTHFIVQLVQ